MPVAVHLGAKPGRERVDAGHAHAVQPAGDLVPAAAELAARVQHGQRHGQRVLAGLFVQADGDAAAVVADRYGLVRVDGDLDVRAIARERLVDRVVDDLRHEVMQPALVRRADVHARAAAHGLQPLQDLYLGRVIGLLFV